MEAKNSYKILVVTDTHDDIEKVKALVNKVQHIKFDFIFCCGDIVSVPIDLRRKGQVRPHPDVLPHADDARDLDRRRLPDVQGRLQARSPRFVTSAFRRQREGVTHACKSL